MYDFTLHMAISLLPTSNFAMPMTLLSGRD